MPARSPITAAITRFEDVFALGLRTLLANDPSVRVLAHDIAHERIGVVLRAHRPQVLILDLGALRDLGELRELCVEHPHTRVVALGQGLSGGESSQVIAFGASACLPRDTQARDLQNAIHIASRGLQLMPRGIDSSASHLSAPGLTPREVDVLLLLREGRSNAQIAASLHIGVETVRTHARGIYRKLGVSSRRALIALTETPTLLPAPPAVARPARPRTPSRAPARRPRHV